MPSPSLMKPSQGVLLLADITGYTMYLQGSELEHAHGVLTDLLDVLVEGTVDILVDYKLEPTDIGTRLTMAGARPEGTPTARKMFDAKDEPFKQRLGAALGEFKDHVESSVVTVASA